MGVLPVHERNMELFDSLQVNVVVKARRAHVILCKTGVLTDDKSDHKMAITVMIHHGNIQGMGGYISAPRAEMCSITETL